MTTKHCECDFDGQAVCGIRKIEEISKPRLASVVILSWPKWDKLPESEKCPQCIKLNSEMDS